jgi:hypothetical protein
MSETRAEHETVETPEEPGEQLDELEDGLVAGRPVEDRGFEAVEIGVGASLGIAIGAAVAGPIGAAAGGLVGAAAGIVAGEAIERAAGHAAETTDASVHETPHHG